jgi:hypothetical protein
MYICINVPDPEAMVASMAADKGATSSYKEEGLELTEYN